MRNCGVDKLKELILGLRLTVEYLMSNVNNLYDLKVIHIKWSHLEFIVSFLKDTDLNFICLLFYVLHLANILEAIFVYFIFISSLMRARLKISHKIVTATVIFCLFTFFEQFFCHKIVFIYIFWYFGVLLCEYGSYPLF